MEKKGLFGLKIATPFKRLTLTKNGGSFLSFGALRRLLFVFINKIRATMFRF